MSDLLKHKACNSVGQPYFPHSCSKLSNRTLRHSEIVDHCYLGIDFETLFCMFWSDCWTSSSKQRSRRFLRLHRLLQWRLLQLGRPNLQRKTEGRQVWKPGTCFVCHGDDETVASSVLSKVEKTSNPQQNGLWRELDDEIIIEPLRLSQCVLKRLRASRSNHIQRRLELSLFPLDELGILNRQQVLHHHHF